MEYQTHILSNGIKLIHMHDESLVAYCGVIINAGSRDEDDDEQGLAHFIEHVVFKGTTKRKSFHILNLLEGNGGELNAYTTKEQTCIYSTFLLEDYEKSIDLMSDILFNSTFPQKELEKEKEIVLDEINSYKDSPSELIFDQFEEMVYENHSIGKNILGTKKHIKRYTKEHIDKFIKNNYFTDEMVVSSIGNIRFDKLVKLVERYFGVATKNIRNKQRVRFDNYTPTLKKVKKNTFQTHCVIGNIAYDLMSDQKNGLLLLNNIIGGPTLNNRLNMSLREKNGYSYAVESSYTPYTDTGLVTIYFGTDKKNLDKCIDLVYKELSIIKNKKLGSQQLHSAKKQILGQLAISRENKENLMQTMGKSYLLFNEFMDINEVKEKIYQINETDLLNIANDIFANDKLSTLIYH